MYYVGDLSRRSQDLRVQTMIRAIYIPILLALSCFLSVEATAKRVAFVVGIDDYDNVPPLKKAVGDARAVSALLDQPDGGSSVSLLENPTRQAFWQGWEAFLERVSSGDEVFIHISSHGIEMGGINYLLPKDAPPVDRGQRVIAQEAIRFSDLLDDLSKKSPRIVLVVLDACRANPYRSRGTRSLGGERGLLPIDPPEGVFVLYSAGVNEEALDRLSEKDKAPTSVYMRTLLPLLQTAQLSIQDVAVLVRRMVAAEAARVNHRQHPAYYDNILTGTYCFSGCLIPTRDDPRRDMAMEVTFGNDSHDLHKSLGRMTLGLREAASSAEQQLPTALLTARRDIQKAQDALDVYKTACDRTDKGSLVAQACDYWKTEATNRIRAAVQQWKNLSDARPDKPSSAETPDRKGEKNGR